MISHPTLLTLRTVVRQLLALFLFAAVGAGLARADSSRLINISTRASVGTDGNILIAGFTVTGSGSKVILVRAIGPTLSEFSLTGVLSDPKLELYDAAGNLLAENDDWDSSNATTFSSAGAFALPTGSKDSALVLTLGPGAYTAHVSGVSGATGTALVEAYDVSAGTSLSLTNLSTRGIVGTGSNVMIAGISLSQGTGTRKVLFRAAGPSLSSFSLTGLLADPKIEVYNTLGTKIAENDNWGTPTGNGAASQEVLSAAFSGAGAFSFLSTSSADSAVLMDLEAGGYTVHVSGADGGTGLAIVEAYDVSDISLPTTGPAIVTQPASTTVSSGSTATFTVSATGTGTLQYQWYKDNAALSGATSATLSVSSTTSASAGTYYVLVTDSNGSTASAPVILYVTTSTTLSAEVYAAAQTFLATLSSSQQSTVQLSWNLTTARHWSNLPASLVSRNGISWGSLSTDQKTAARALIQAALGDTGNTLHEGMQAADDYLYSNGGGSSYGAGAYYIAFLGTPSTSDFWLLQLTGHHLTFNLAFNTTYKSPTPLFLGVEPKGSFTQSGVTYDPMSSQREALASLISALSGYSSAKLSGTYTDILFGANGSGGIDGTYPKSYPTGTSGRGILYSSLSTSDQAKVVAAIKSYVNTQASEYANDLLSAYLSDTALASTYVAYSGSSNLTTKNSYIRIDGPRVWIELTVQSGVIFQSDIHYHSVWRDKDGDYGGNF